MDAAGSKKAGMFSVIKNAHTNSSKTIPQNVIKIEKLAELVEIVEQLAMDI
jgi:serine/threonine protein kinase HipA of HipAB toxin-antitoxin module